MNESEFDTLIKESLSRQADQHIAQQPMRLAMRRLAVRVSETRPDVRPTFLGAASPGGLRQRRVVQVAGSVAGLAAVLLVALVAISYLRGPSNQFGATGPIFVSERHGYSLRLPDDSWQITEVPGEWQLGTFLDALSPGTDYFEKGQEAPVQDLVYAWLSSQPIPTEMTFDGWLYVQDGVTAASASCFQLQGAYEDVLVGGEQGRLGVYYCPDFRESGIAWATVQVLLAHEGRGYALYFWPEQEADLAPLPDIAQLNDVKLEARSWLSRFTFTEPDASP